MTGALAIIAFFLIITGIICVHELGHLLMARRFDMKVEEYFAGFGPRLWSFRRGETEYGVKAFLMGGYVKIAGMNPYVPPAEEDLPRTFGAKPIWQRTVTILAGPLSHFLMAFLAVFLWLMLVGQPTHYSAEIGSVEPKLNGQTSPAQAAGLKPGDVIVRIDGESVDAEGFVKLTRADRNGAPLSLVVERDGEELTLTAVPVLAQVDGEQVPRLGVVMSGGQVLARDRMGPIAAVSQAAQVTWETTRQVFLSFGRIFGPEGIGRMFSQVFGDTQRTLDDPVSIVGGARVAGQAASAGQWDLALGLFVGLNIFLGLLNLVPLPPFDGGHILALAIEKIRRRPVDMRKMVPIGAAVFALLMVFAVALLYLDIAKPLPSPVP